MPKKISRQLPPGYKLQRLDVALFEQKIYVSRAQAKHAIEKGNVKVNGAILKPGARIGEGALIEAILPDLEPGPGPENIPISIIYEDKDIVVIDKPAGLVVHPAAGNRTGTLVNALIYHCDNLSGIGGVLRPGVVHRLDKDTSGIIVFAKNDTAHLNLTQQFRDRKVTKVYLAVIIGRMPKPEGCIDTMIGRNPIHRTKMHGTTSDGREAMTRWREIETYPGASLLEITPHTGRTHQIRVHLSEAGHPVVGDRVYGTKKRLKGIQNRDARHALENMHRQALHAHKLTLSIPGSGEIKTFISEPPEDLRLLIETLRNAPANNR